MMARCSASDSDPMRLAGDGQKRGRRPPLTLASRLSGVRVRWHSGWMDESRHPRYCDNEGSRFYRAGRLSPQETWQVLGDEMGRVLDGAERAFWRKPLRMDPERVRWWHGAIFARPFPQDGGRFRRERAFFGVVMPAGGMRQLEGSSPETLRRDLEVLCVSFNRCVDAFSDSAAPELIDCTRAAGALYAGILRVHPFADGNHRTSFVALSSALWSFGLPNVRFVDDAEMIAHDDAVTGALLSDAGDVEPFARLLAERIEGGRKDPT
jgi:prophage maintenance system killer protein